MPFTTLQTKRLVYQLLNFSTVQQRHFSTASVFICNCHKSPTELQQKQQQQQQISDEPEESHDLHKHSNLFQLIRTALDEEAEPREGTDHEHNIHRNIRPAATGEQEVVTEKLKELLRGVNHGNRAKLAEAITLSE